MVQVQKELVESFFERYELGKNLKNYTDEFIEDQPVLAELVNGLLDQFKEESALCKTKAEMLNLCKKQVTGMVIMIYSLLKEQEEIDELEKQYA